MPSRKSPSSKPSPIVPLLVGPIICDVAALDPSSGKWSLIGIFGNITVTTFPTARKMTVYFRLSDAEGRYDVEVRFIRSDDGVQIAKATAKVDVKDRLSQPQLAIPFPALQIEREATYEFQIWSNGIFLGSNSITATQR